MSTNTTAPLETTFQKAVPEYLRIYGFDVLNLGAYYCAAGPALGLYIKYLGGSTTYMGLVMACMPACQLLQVFVAPHLERWGIKQVMVTSLVIRNLMHLLLAILPFLAGWLVAEGGARGTGFFAQPAALMLAALFVIMLGFDLCQGLGFSGWMTWVNYLVPEKFRGRYFAFEQMMNNLGQMAFSGVAGWILGVQGTQRNYGTLFMLGAVCGWASIAFLSRITASPKKSTEPEFNSLNLGWVRTVWCVPGFRRMMYVIWAHQLMLSVGYFLVYFQKDSLQLSDQFLMMMNTVGIIGGVLSVYVWGSLADRFGSKPVMALAYYLILGVSAYWVALGLGLPFAQKPLLIFVQFLYVAGLQGYVVTNMRYVLGSLPSERMVYGTIFYNLTVQVSTMVGAMFWGSFLDLSVLRALNEQHLGLRLDRFTVVFALMLLLALLARFFVHRLSNNESGANALKVAWFAVRQDPTTQRILLFFGAGIAALPLSYFFQPQSWREQLGLQGYCVALLQGLDGVAHPSGVLTLFWTAFGIVMALCSLLVFKGWPQAACKGSH